MTLAASERKRRSADALDQIVDTIIRESPVPIGAYTIAERTATYSKKLAPTQVYRSISRLIDAGRITHLVSCNAYVSGQNRSAFYLLCPDCKNYQTKMAPEETAKLRALCKDMMFECRGLHVELTGPCPACQARQQQIS